MHVRGGQEMKYASLLGTMAFYGSYVKEHRILRSLSYEAASRGYNAETEYSVFQIETAAPNGNGQIMKSLVFNRAVSINIFGCMVPNQVDMPPILEIEWMRARGQFSEEQMDVLEYVGYMFIMQILTGTDNRPPHDTDQSRYYELMTGTRAVVEAEDIMDTPAILSACDFPQTTLPKIKSWNMLYIYADNFSELFRLCTGQSQSFKELYVHLPVLLAMFMVEHDAESLGKWSKSERLQMENWLQEFINNFTRYTISPGTRYTYGSSTGITRMDINLQRAVFNYIYNAIHEQNSDIGLILYSDYCQVKGPETIKADVRLSGIVINWKEELARARELEQAKGQEDGFDGE